MQAMRVLRGEVAGSPSFAFGFARLEIRVEALSTILKEVSVSEVTKTDPGTLDIGTLEVNIETNASAR